MRKMKKRLAFTLVELLVVVAIIGILATVVAISYGNAVAKARDTRRMSDLNAISQAEQLLYQDKGDYKLNGYGAGGLGAGNFNEVYSGTTLAAGFVASGYLTNTLIDPSGSTWCGGTGSNIHPSCYMLYAVTGSYSVYAALEQPSSSTKNIPLDSGSGSTTGWSSNSTCTKVHYNPLNYGGFINYCVGN